MLFEEIVDDGRTITMTHGEVITKSHLESSAQVIWKVHKLYSEI